jgi:hypothetical protein
METAIASDIQANPKLHRTVARANELLIGDMGHSTEPPRAVWRLYPRSNGHQQIELELLYHDEAVQKQFVPDELTDESELRFRVGRLWEDLLLKANKSTTNRLLAILREWRHEMELQEK